MRDLSAIGVVALAIAGCSDDGAGRDARRSVDAPRDATYWYLESISQGGRTLEIVYFFGDRRCESLRGAEISESPHAVELTVRLRRFPGSGTCTDILHSATMTVGLQGPLGSRRLVDPGGGPPNPELGSPPFGWPESPAR